jgi:hypothetical protein
MGKYKAQNFKKLARVPAWTLLFISFIFGVVAIFSLRANNLRAIELAEKVTQVDEADGDVEAALKELREHIYAHMNAGLRSDTGIQQPPIRLFHRYERLKEAEAARVEALRSQILIDAQTKCEAEFPNDFSGRVRVPCVQAYIDSNKVEEQTISPDLYMFDFASPTWSPDLAGWSLVLAVIFAGAFIISIVSELFLRQHFHGN